MSWRYQVVRYADGSGYGLHEVHYDQAGNPYSMTERPAGFTCGEDEEPTTVLQALVTALQDGLRGPVFNEPASWRKHGDGPTP